jgi:signal peptidase I
MEPLDDRVEEKAALESVGPAAPTRTSRRESAWETVRSLLLVLLGVFCVRTFIAEATVIPTGSMEQTILIGDHVFLDKLLYGPRLPYTSLRVPPLKTVRRQEIIAFRYPRNPSLMFVKRVIGKGGDVVRIEDKKVFVNGQPWNEPYVQFQSSATFPLRDDFPPAISQLETLPAAWGLDPGWAREMPSYIGDDGLHVPPGYLFVMGDNRDHSYDSRYWGFVNLKAVKGKAFIIYWSWDKDNFGVRWERLANILK